VLGHDPVELVLAFKISDWAPLAHRRPPDDLLRQLLGFVEGI